LRKNVWEPDCTRLPHVLRLAGWEIQTRVAGSEFIQKGRAERVGPSGRKLFRVRKAGIAKPRQSRTREGQIIHRGAVIGQRIKPNGILVADVKIQSPDVLILLYKRSRSDVDSTARRQWDKL